MIMYVEDNVNSKLEGGRGGGVTYRKIVKSCLIQKERALMLKTSKSLHKNVVNVIKVS